MVSSPKNNPPVNKKSFNLFTLDDGKSEPSHYFVSMKSKTTRESPDASNKIESISISPNFKNKVLNNTKKRTNNKNQQKNKKKDKKMDKSEEPSTKFQPSFANTLDNTGIVLIDP